MHECQPGSVDRLSARLSTIYGPPPIWKPGHHPRTLLIVFASLHLKIPFQKRKYALSMIERA